MRVLVVSQYFWPESFRINEIVSSLADRGLKIDVLTGKPNYPEGTFYEGYRGSGINSQEWSGASIYRVPIVARGKSSALKLALNYISFIVSGLILGPWILRKKEYDVVFVYGLSPIMLALPALLIGKLKKVPVVTWVQDLWPESMVATGYVRNRLLFELVKKVVKFIYHRTDLLLVQSEAFVEPVRAMAAGTPVSYHPNSVDKSFLRSSDSKLPDIPALESKFSVLFAGNLGSAQAVEVIVEAADLLKAEANIRFVVLGQGSRRAWMKREIDKRGLKNVSLAGQHPLNTMPGLMQKASVLLVSLSDRPIFALTVPSKVQAYMAAGKPIVACLNGEGARVVLEADAGVAVPAENSEALAEAILKLYNMPEDIRNNLGKNGRKYCENNYNHDQLVDKLVDHFSRTIESG